jgi:ABC-type Fe3+-siderophore transport system permease subunit
MLPTLLVYQEEKERKGKAMYFRSSSLGLCITAYLCPSKVNALALGMRRDIAQPLGTAINLQHILVLLIALQLAIPQSHIAHS